MTDCVKERKKIFRTRARTGCKTCRAAHVRCDENKPLCTRCSRLGRVCVYINIGRPTTSATETSLRPLAPAVTKSFSPDQLYANLNPSSVVYFDFFRTHVVFQLSRQPDGPAGFWSHTLLRECTLDSGVVDAVVSIGALSRARYEGLQPHHKLQDFGPLSCIHYYVAIRHYTRAVADFGRRIASISRTPIPPRTLLIFTILFSMFEILHGNTGACDNLISNGLRLFSDPKQTRQKSLSIKPALDDVDIHDAELFLARTATWSAIFSPMYPRSRDVVASMASSYELGDLPPDRQHSSVTYFWRKWWQFVTMAVIWHLRVQTARASGSLDEHLLLRLREEQRLLLERTTAWVDETRARLDRVVDDQFAKHILTMLLFEIRISYWSGYYALDPGETAWESCVEDCIEILDMARDTIMELTSTMGYESIVSDGLMIGLLQLSRECRDRTVRIRALDLCKLLITPSSSWHVKSFVLGASACVTAEEAGREEGTGQIPMVERYDWTDGSWSDDFTQLRITVTSKGEDCSGFRKKKHVVLRPDMLRVS